MKWTDLLKGNIEYTYGVTEKLLDEVDDSNLDWKPETGGNWLTTGQLCMHITNACGMGFKGFVTGEWGIPEEDMKPESMLPPAEKFPTVGSVAEAKKLLAEDKQVALKMLAEAGEETLETKPTPAPWDPTPMPLGHRLMTMVGHLEQHKAQLFYYLKLQGKPVNTHHLLGM